MYISMDIDCIRSYGTDKEVIKLMKDCGFTAYDYSCFKLENFPEDYIEKAKELRAYADSIGIVCNQAHAPFPTARLNNDEYNEKIFPVLVKSLEVSGILGAKVCVIHPCNDWSAKENAEKLYLKLAPYARKASVKIGVENMWNWFNWGKTGEHVLPAACSHQDDFKAHMDLLPTDAFTACVDVGHAEMMHAYGTTAAKIIETLGSYVGAMHLHDVDFTHDNHTLPFTQKIEFAEVIAALKKIGYEGDITLESSNSFKRVPVELIPAAVTYGVAVANYFKEQIEN